MTKRWLQPTAIVSLIGAVAMLARCWAETAATLDQVEDARWKRANGMSFYEQAFKDAMADKLVLEAAVMAATNLTELKLKVKGN